MLRLKSNAGRAIRIATAGALSLSMLAPVLISNVSHAAQVENRYVKMSSSSAGATGVTYEIGFKPSATSFQSVVVEFCSDSPLLSTACTTTAGTVPTFTVAAPVGGGSNTDAWTAGNSASNVVKVNGSAVTSNTDMTIHITGVTNPTTVGTFYARIYTYSANSYTGFTGGVTSGTTIDAGGVALSIANDINISARVQESLIFCVSGGVISTGCTGTTAATLELGHGSPKILDASAVDTAVAYFQVSTNAGGGVTVRMKGNTLYSGTPFIRAANTVNGGLNTITLGTADFGMRIGTGSGTDYSASNITPDANYFSATQYGLDITTAGNNVTTGSGDPIAQVSASQDTFAKMTFAAAASVTTPAGLYTATENLIATGTY